MVLLIAAGPAWPQDFRLPPSLLLPNYDRVYPGLFEALEAGAFTARAMDAPAVAYNPAGLGLTERSTVNASAQGYQLTAVGGSGFQHATPVSSFETIPGFVGVVLSRDVLGWETVRLGFAVVTPVHWDQSVTANSTPSESQRISYGVHSSFSTVVPTFAVGWAVSSSIRLGASIEFPYTSLSDTGQLSGELTTTTMSQGTVRTVAAGGSTLDVDAVAGAQWSALRWLHLGLLFRSPGLKVLSTGSFVYESLATPTSGSRHISFTDPNARFEYRSPMEVVLGAAVELGPVQVEMDIRWHDGTHTYPLFSSTTEGRVVDTTSGVPVISSFGFPGVPYRARQLWNGNVGARIRLSQWVSLHGGVYLDQSPVDLLGQGFRRVDLIGFRTGVGFQADKLSASLGVGWENGKATDDLSPDGTVASQQDQLTLNTFSVLFSLSYKF
jgi:hypothetical protein